MLETIAVLLLQASTPTSAAWGPPGAPLSEEALAMERSSPLPRPLRPAVHTAPLRTGMDWAGGDRFDYRALSVSLTTQIVAAMMQPDPADFGFNPGFLLTPGTTVTVLATVNGRDFELR